MKHIFLVHSPITYYSALSVVDKEKLDIKDVIFLLKGNYDNSHKLPIRMIRISDWINFPYPLKIRSIFKSSYYIKEIDKKIYSVCNGLDYIVYIPTASSLMNQVFISNKYCKGYNFIEEGIANYRLDLYEKPAVPRGKLITIFCGLYNIFSNRILLNHPFLKKFTKSKFIPKYYYFSNKYHYIDKNPNIRYMEFYRDRQSEYHDYSNCNIFIMSNLIEYRLCNRNSLENVLTDFFKKLKFKESLHIKFHPQQSKETIDLFGRIAQINGCKINVIDNSISMEQVFMNSDNITLYGFESSLLFYSKVLNNTIKSYSLSNKLSDCDEIYRKWISSLPKEVTNTTLPL